MTRAPQSPRQSLGVKRCVLVLTAAWTLLSGAYPAFATDPLTQAERAWLDSQDEIVFVSQTDYPPFEFVDTHGNHQGMCIELARWMSTELGFRAAFRDMTFQQAQYAVLSGEADVLTSLFYSDERDRRFDFSEMTWEVPALIFVRAERPDITTVEDLQGKRVAMQRGDYAAEYLESRRIDYELVPTATFAEATDLVIAGEADAVIGDRQIVLYHLFSNGLTDQMKSVGEPLYVGRNCMGVREGRHELVGILTKGLALAREHSVFESITRKWVGTQYAAETTWLQRHAWHLVIVLAVVAAFAALVVVWSVHLQRVVARRTRELLEVHDTLRPIERGVTGRPGLKKWLLVAAALSPLLLGGAYALRQYVIMPSFLSLEQAEAEKTISGCMDAVRREAHHLGYAAGDWAVWDETYQFAQDGNTAYAVSNFQWESLLNSGIHLIYVCDREGNVVWGSIYDPVGSVEVALAEFPEDALPKDHPLLQHESLHSNITGIILTDRGPMLISSLPILTSTGKGPSRGTFIVGRFLLEETVQDLSEQSRVWFTVRDLRTSEFNERERAILAVLSPGTQMTEEIDDDVLMGYGILADIEGNPALLVSATLPRAIVRQVRAVARLVSIILLVAVAVVGLFLFLWSMSFLAEFFRRQGHVEALVEERTSALRESEERTRATFNAISDTVFLHPLLEEGFAPFIDVNNTACERYGFTREEFLALKVPDIMKKTDAYAYSARDHRRKLSDGQRLIFEATHVTKSGEEFPVEINSTVIELDGRPMILGVVRDITERKKAEAEHERLMAAIEQAAEIVIITDVESTIQYVNPAFEQITGYTRNEAIGRNPRMLQSGEQDDAFYKEMWDTLTRGETWSGRFINKKKDETLYTEEATISPVHDASGQTVNYVAVKRDITHEIKLEEQFRQAQKMEAVGQLAGGIAHDFNNLLQVINGYSELALGNLNADHPAFGRVEEVARAGKRAATLVRQLLAFSRQQVLDMRDVNLNDVVADLMKMIRRVIGEHITLDVLAGHDLGIVRADPGQIEQILMNLCVNARDAMAGGGTIVIETSNVRIDEVYCKTRPWAEPGQFVLLSVTDTGCGMDKETLANVFEPFFTTKDVGAGTGLGLSTVYGLVKQHEGMVDVYSEVGTGTTFNIYLPLTERSAAIVGDKIETTAPGGTETILLAEDDVAVLGLAKAILEHAGYTVLTAADGEEALRVFEEYAEAIDLALLDAMMPELGGRAVFERIREQRPEIRVLFSSGYSMKTIHTNFVLDEGMQLIQKPYQRDTLLQRIREALDS